jgi:hypothetical protein
MDKGDLVGLFFIASFVFIFYMIIKNNMEK